MVRTQIYLTRDEARALEKRSKETGQSKSQLIRDAIDSAYMHPAKDKEALLRTLRSTAGAWGPRRESSIEYIDRLRSGDRLAQPHRTGRRRPKPRKPPKR